MTSQPSTSDQPPGQPRVDESTQPTESFDHATARPSTSKTQDDEKVTPFDVKQMANLSPAELHLLMNHAASLISHKAADEQDKIKQEPEQDDTKQEPEQDVIKQETDEAVNQLVGSFGHWDDCGTGFQTLDLDPDMF